MIVAINTGRKGSKGFPGKNTHYILNHPLAYYCTKAAIDTEEINNVYMSTDDEKLMNMSEGMGVEVIKRPSELCNDDALSSDVFLHAVNTIEEQIYPKKLELIVLLMANAPTITNSQLSKGIMVLRKHSDYDSAVTVSHYNMWNPTRARKINEKGLLEPYAPETLKSHVTSNRNSSKDAWFADMGASIIRPKCIHNIKSGVPPQPWMGKNIYPLKQECGLDIDYEWQLPIAEYWLKKYGGYQ